MLDLAFGLSPRALSEISALEAEVVAADGGRLKLEWNTLKSRSGNRVEDILWWQQERLVGFLGVYTFGGATAELAGMVHPDFRRQGIGSRLLDEAITLCRQQAHQKLLLVAPRASPGARVLALERRGFLEHSEHALDLHQAAVEGSPDPSITLRVASSDDISDVERILVDSFGEASDPLNRDSYDEALLVAQRDGVVIATLRVSKAADEWGVYGFAVESQHRGVGVGRELLRRVCRQANDAGVKRVHLEVEVDNDRALGLYTSLGFTRTSTEDYFNIPL